MNDLISRNALMEYARNHIGHTIDCNDIARFPAANAKCGTWYPNEIVSSSEHAAALDTINHRHFNYVLTHTCPTDWQPVDLFMKNLDQNKVNTTMEEYLDDVLRYIGGYDYWYFGHYHANRDYDKISDYDWNDETIMLFNEIRRIL